MRKWVYIRFNPDNYNKKNKKMITPLKDRLPTLLQLFTFQTPIFSTIYFHQNPVCDTY
jgi:hypothetical protein